MARRNAKTERRTGEDRRQTQTGESEVSNEVVRAANADQVKIQGITVDVPRRYAEGHTLTGPEANALNSYFSNRVTGSVTAEVKNLLGEKKYSELSADDQGDIADKVQELVTNAAENYSFGSRRAGRTSNPLATETMNLARDLVRRQLKDKGVNLSTVSAKRVSELAKRILSDPKRGEKIRASAEANIKKREELEALDLNDLTD